MKNILALKPINYPEFIGLLHCVPNIEKVDVVEIWFDETQNQISFLKKFEERRSQFLQKLGKEDLQFFFTCKGPREKGVFYGSESERMSWLCDFLDLKGGWIDLDIRYTEAEAIQNIINDYTSENIILSYHDFEGVPEDLSKITESMKAYNPYFYKIAVTPNSEAEMERFIEFARNFVKKNPRSIFTTMGKEWGLVGRKKLENISWGSFFALTDATNTASGQPTIEDMK